MNTPQTHFKCVSGNLMEPVYFVSSAFSTGALASEELTLLTKPGLVTATLTDYIATYDMVLEAIDFKCPAGGSTGAGVLSVDALTIDSCVLGAFTVATNTAGAITWGSNLTQVGSSIWRRLLMRDLMKITAVGRTHKGILMTAGYAMSSSSFMMGCTLASGAYTGSKYVGARLIFKNVDGQGYKISDFAL